MTDTTTTGRRRLSDRRTGFDPPFSSRTRLKGRMEPLTASDYIPKKMNGGALDR